MKSGTLHLRYITGISTCRRGSVDNKCYSKRSMYCACAELKFDEVLR